MHERGGACVTGGVRDRRGACMPHTPPPVNRITDRCKNITFAQTTFAGGNNDIRIPGVLCHTCSISRKKSENWC